MIYSIRCDFKTTNNEVEYIALIARIDMAYDLGATMLHVKNDSLLVVNKMNGEFQAKDSKMMAYLKLAKTKSERFENILIEQIPRDQNTQVDTLTNLRSTLGKNLRDTTSCEEVKSH